MYVATKFMSGNESYYTAGREAYYAPDKKGHAQSGDPAGVWTLVGKPPHPLFGHHAEVDTLEFKAICNGFDPKNPNTKLVKNAGAEGRVGGYDMTFTADKSVTVLWAVGEHVKLPTGSTVTHEIEEAQRMAVERALNFAAEQGLFATRTGKDGKDKMALDGVAIARFRHSSSRAGDPHLHDHCVLPNTVMCADGKARALDASELYRYRSAMNNLYHAELAAQLQQRLGVEIEASHNSFTVKNVDQRVIDEFSTRTKQMEQWILAELGEANDAELSAMSRAALGRKKDLAALATRGSKKGLPTYDELKQQWADRVAALGTSYEAVVAGAIQRRDPPALTAEESKEIVTATIRSLTTHEVVISDRKLIAEVASALVGRGGADQAEAAVEQAKLDGAVIVLGKDKNGRDVYSTEKVVELERSMLAHAIHRKDERQFVSSYYIEKAISDRPTMREDQKAMVRHALNKDGVSIIEGPPGSGKSFALAAVKDAAGYETHIVAPTWKAADVVGRDTGTDDARALAGFLNRIEKGEIQLTKRSMVICDEFGMVSNADAERLLRLAAEAGAKVVLADDTRQLEAVGAGAPMRTLAENLGTQRLTVIERQQSSAEDVLVHRGMDRDAALLTVKALSADDRDKLVVEGGRAAAKAGIAWQREASYALTDRKGDKAIDAYDKRGLIEWTKGGSGKTLAALAHAWKQDVQRQPDATRIVIAKRNADVRLLNQILRQAWRDCGKLSDPEVAIKTKHKDGTVRDANYAVGDRIAMTTTIKEGRFSAFGVNNGDTATITAISETHIAFRLDKDGSEIRTPLDGLAGYRPPNDKSDPRPCFIHAYATTNHGGQGATVDQAYLLLGDGGMNGRGLNVGLTRHKHGCKVFVDVDAMRDIVSGRRDPASQHKKIDLSEVKSLIKSSALEWTQKLNASSFQLNVQEWVGPAPQTLAHRKIAVRMPELAKVAEPIIVDPAPAPLIRLPVAPPPYNVTSQQIEGLIERFREKNAPTREPEKQAEIVVEIEQEHEYEGYTR